MACGARTQLDAPVIDASVGGDVATIDGAGGDAADDNSTLPYCANDLGPVAVCPSNGAALRCSGGRVCTFDLGHDGLWGCCMTKPITECDYADPQDPLKNCIDSP